MQNLSILKIVGSISSSDISLKIVSKSLCNMSKFKLDLSGYDAVYFNRFSFSAILNQTPILFFETPSTCQGRRKLFLVGGLKTRMECQYVIRL